MKSINLLHSLIILLTAAIPLAHACQTEEALTQAEKDQADTVFMGRATAYAPSTSEKPTEITFRIEKVIHGQPISSTLSVYWQNGNFGESQSLAEFQKDYGEQTIVGVIFPKTYISHITCSNEDAVNGLGKPVKVSRCSTDIPLPFYPTENANFYDKPWVIGKVCSPAFLTPAG